MTTTKNYAVFVLYENEAFLVRTFAHERDAKNFCAMCNTTDKDGAEYYVDTI